MKNRCIFYGLLDGLPLRHFRPIPCALLFALGAAFPTASIPLAFAAPDAEALLGQIAAALGQGEAVGAERLASTALQAGEFDAPDRAKLLVDRGLARERLGEGNDAVVDFTDAIGLHSLSTPDAANALFDRGVTLDEMGRTGDAIGDYSAAIALTPGFARALNNRANVYRRQGHHAEAKRDYRASLAADNLHPEYPYYGLGEIAESEGDKALAREDYAKAIAANPQYDLASIRLAALGGTPDSGDIVLRPPPGVSADSVAAGSPGSTVVSEAATGEEPVILRPPQTVHLHPPGSQSTLTSASFGRGADAPGLRSTIVDGGKTLGPQIQLGAWRSEAEAVGGWNRAVGQAGNLLDGLAPHIVVADLPGKGRYYRLRVGPVARADAAKLCAALVTKGLECIPARD